MKPESSVTDSPGAVSASALLCVYVFVMCCDNIFIRLRVLMRFVCLHGNFDLLFALTCARNVLASLAYYRVKIALIMESVFS